MGEASARTAATGAVAQKRRLTALDAFRGLTVASMIFVSSLGDTSVVGQQLRHASWHGATFRDLIAPFFLFAMGAGMAFAFARYVDRGQDPPYARILRRGLSLFVVGIGLNVALYAIPDGNLADLRLMGVLQRIALAYLVSAVVVLATSARVQAALGAALLAGYEALLHWFPVPGHGAGVLTPEGNVAGWVDRVVIGEANLHRGGPTDPEGLLATLPAVVTVLLGYWTGRWLLGRSVSPRVSIRLVVLGAAAIGGALLWAEVTPLNKALWTPSFVLLTAGWGWLVLGVWYQAVEVWRTRRLGWTFEVLGRNSLFAFVVPRVVANLLDEIPVEGPDGTVGLFTRVYEVTVASWAPAFIGANGASILFGLLVLVVWWFVHLAMYRRGVFLRL